MQSAISEMLESSTLFSHLILCYVVIVVVVVVVFAATTVNEHITLF